MGITKGAGIKAASYASAAVYTATNEVVDYVTGKKDLTAENVANSVLTVIGDTIVNGTINYLANAGAAKMVPTNSGWFVPKKFLSYFTKTFGQRMMVQTAIAGSLVSVMSMMWRSVKEIG